MRSNREGGRFALRAEDRAVGTPNLIAPRNPGTVLAPQESLRIGRFIKGRPGRDSGIAQSRGHPARDVDFIIPGDLAGARHGVRDPRTDACHVTQNQASSWGSRFFTPAVTKVAEQPEFFHILGATPYALRRGGISLRLRAEDPQTVASECGTSLQMLSAHYAFAIEDLRQHGPRPVDVEWRAARAARVDSKPHKEGLRTAFKRDRGGGESSRKSFFAWLSAHRQAQPE